jgi:hypothetical protein
MPWMKEASRGFPQSSTQINARIVPSITSRLFPSKSIIRQSSYHSTPCGADADSVVRWTAQGKGTWISDQVTHLPQTGQSGRCRRYEPDSDVRTLSRDSVRCQVTQRVVKMVLGHSVTRAWSQCTFLQRAPNSVAVSLASREHTRKKNVRWGSVTERGLSSISGKCKSLLLSSLRPVWNSPRLLEADHSRRSQFASCACTPFSIVQTDTCLGPRHGREHSKRGTAAIINNCFAARLIAALLRTVSGMQMYRGQDFHSVQWRDVCGCETPSLFAIKDEQ